MNTDPRDTGRGGVAIDGKRVPWNVVHDDLLTYGETRQAEPDAATTGAGWLPR
jgi:hypothetical protein